MADFYDPANPTDEPPNGGGEKSSEALDAKGVPGNRRSRSLGSKPSVDDDTATSPSSNTAASGPSLRRSKRNGSKMSTRETLGIKLGKGDAKTEGNSEEKSEKISFTVKSQVLSSLVQYSDDSESSPTDEDKELGKKSGETNNQDPSLPESKPIDKNGPSEESVSGFDRSHVDKVDQESETSSTHSRSLEQEPSVNVKSTGTRLTRQNSISSESNDSRDGDGKSLRRSSRLQRSVSPSLDRLRNSMEIKRKGRSKSPQESKSDFIDTASEKSHKYGTRRRKSENLEVESVAIGRRKTSVERDSPEYKHDHSRKSRHKTDSMKDPESPERPHHSDIPRSPTSAISNTNTRSRRSRSLGKRSHSRDLPFDEEGSIKRDAKENKSPDRRPQDHEEQKYSRQAKQISPEAVESKEKSELKDEYLSKVSDKGDTQPMGDGKGSIDRPPLTPKSPVAESAMLQKSKWDSSDDDEVILPLQSAYQEDHIKATGSVSEHNLLLYRNQALNDSKKSPDRRSIVMQDKESHKSRRSSTSPRSTSGRRSRKSSRERHTRQSRSRHSLSPDGDKRGTQSQERRSRKDKARRTHSSEQKEDEKRTRDSRKSRSHRSRSSSHSHSSDRDEDRSRTRETRKSRSHRSHSSDHEKEHSRSREAKKKKVPTATLR